MNTKSCRWSKEQFLDAVKSSISIAEVLKKIGLKPTGANYFTAKKFFKEWSIDTSHFLGQCHLLGKTRNLPPIPLEKLLIKNGTTCRSTIKKRIIRDGLLLNKCNICGQNPLWNEKKLIMILDHINGINNDNRIENLRLLCPNCNSQLTTFCGRKNKKDHFCKICGNKVFKGNDRCRQCSDFAQRKVSRPTYEELKIDAENLSIRRIGEKYGVSANSIKKWIKMYKKQNSNQL